jgi:hypothetical protein
LAELAKMGGEMVKIYLDLLYFIKYNQKRIDVTLKIHDRQLL